MKRLALLFIGLSSLVLSVLAQEGDYDKAIRAYRENKLDSAGDYIASAVTRYQQHAQLDSLVFSYVQQALVVWTQTGLEEAVDVMDIAVGVARKLPLKSVARVAAYSRMGQLLTQQYDFKAAANYFDRAEAAVESSKPPNRHYVLLYNYIAVMHLTLDDFVPAMRYVQRAYDMNAALEGKDGIDMPMILQVRYYISRYSEDYQQALVDAKEFQRVIQLHYPPDHPNIGVMHNSLAIIYETLHRYEEAFHHRQKSVNIQLGNYINTKNGFSLAAAYQNLGQLYGYVNEPFLAQEYLEKGSKLLEQTYGEEGLGMVKVWVDLAVHKSKVGQYGEARRLLAKAYDVQQKQGGDDVAGIAYVEVYLGDWYFDQAQYREAGIWYLKALDRYRRSGAQHTELALYAKKNLAVTMAAAGQVDEALVLQRIVLAEFRKIYPYGHETIADKLHGISGLYLDAGRSKEALAFSDSVFVEILMCSTLPSNAANWISRLPFSHNTSIYIHRRMQILQQLYAKSGNRSFLIQLLSLTDNYADLISNNLHVFRSQAALIDLAGVNKEIYSMAVEACWELAEKEKDQRYLARAFGYAERGKALLLRLAANNMLVDAQGGETDAVETRDRDFRTRIGVLNLQYLNGGRDDSLLTLLSNAMERYRDFQDSLKKLENKTLRVKHELDPYPIDEIKKHLLRRGETLIEYAVTDQSVFIFVLTPTSFHVHRADRAVLDGIKYLKELHGLTAESFGKRAFALYQALIEPVKSHFAGNRLLIVPDAALYALNFEILISDRPTKLFSKMPYLIHQYDVSYLLSAASAMQFRKAFRGESKERALLFAPVFTDKMKADYRESLSGQADDDYLYLYRQPFSLQAALKIGRWVNNDLYAEQLAQEHLFKRLAPEYRILHFGTHAEVNNESPLQSRLFFAKALAEDTLNTDDGYLYAYEIYAMQLRAELAVLTACETGAGAWRDGEGVISLAHSFMHAGCPSVVMSLWKIDEKASTEIIAKFYEYLAKGKSKSEALRESKLRWIRAEDDRLAHPYYWAGLALIGDRTPLYEDYTWLYWVASLTTLAIAAMAFFRRRKHR
ncbi:CHAT domain-containing tetratricopeptide repeat protein [Parapedobacter pyrenivorans]|uniref:CHAT domain-containing tetratricopeptide repeat protein n=1 Tax=Parapedobacter pyrenivorans TaxID=1305674 RepID=UPI00333E5757